MNPRESGAFDGETSPFLSEAPLSIAARTEVDSFLAEEMTGRLETPWLSEELAAEPFAAEDEVWNDSSEQVDFRERVLNAHIERSRKALGKRTPLRDLRDDELAAVAGTGIRMKSDAAGPAGRLIKAANAALKDAQAAGDESALVTTRITANSGYRGKEHQRGLWLDYFRGYYNDTPKAREKLAGGPHSDQAVAYMLNTFGIPGKIAAPGYSNHQAGIAIDLAQERMKGHRVRNSTSSGWRETWRKTWFHQWLKEHAASFGFVPYWKEEWHWEYKPQAAAKLQAGESPDDREWEVEEAERGDALPEPPGKTLYEDIDLGIGTVAVQVLIRKLPKREYKTVQVAVKPKTGIFIPDGYLPGAELDVVLYLHGHTTGYPGRNVSIDGYWTDVERYFALREHVNASGKNVVLIAPTLGPHSEAGSLDDAGGLDSFLDRVVNGLSKCAAFTNRRPAIGSIILAGHSGAGDPMLTIASSRSPMAAKIRECWLFDALYGGIPKWEKWIKAHPAGIFYSYHAGGAPTRNSKKLGAAIDDAGLTNAFIVPPANQPLARGPGHFRVPMTFFPRRLRETSWLQDRSSTVWEQEEFSGEEDAEAPENEEELELDAEEPESEDPPVDSQFFTDEEEEGEGEGGEEEEEESFDVTDGYEASVDEEELFESETFPSGESLPGVTGFPEGKGEDYWDPSNSGNPLLDTGPAHKDKHLSANITVREMTTSGGKSVDVARIDRKLVECLQRLRDHVGKPVTITSGYRSWKRNKEVYAARNQKPTLSQHCGGRAADIRIPGMNGLQIGKAAIDACGPDIGVGLGSTFAHIDVRGYAAAWDYGGATAAWVAEIKRYQKSGSSRASLHAAPATPASQSSPAAPAGPPALGGPLVPGKDYKKYKRGLKRPGVGRLDRVLRDLRTRGLLVVSDDDIDTFQRVANVETSGLIQALNTWDSAVVSIGFMQWTLQYQELHRWIGKAASAFRRFGIEIDPTRSYTIGDQQVPAIRGAATHDELRWDGWAQRFYLAGLDPEIIVAEVEHATAFVIPGKLRAAKGWLKGNAEGIKLFEQSYQGSLPFRGLFVEAHNNRPAAARAGVKNGIARALADGVSSPADVYAIMKEEILAAYVVQGFRSKGENVVNRTAQL